jgi:TRAP-type C4-dicarboxylate transport system permease small subunit
MNRLRTLIRHLEETVAAVFLIIMVVVVTVDVIGRYVFNHPLLWSGELATTLFIWQTFLAAAGALRRGLHIGIEFVVDTFPVRLRALTNLVIYLLMGTMLVIGGYMGWGYALQAHFKMLQILGISYTVVNLAVPVGCLLMTVHLTSYVYQAARGFWTNQYEPRRIGFAGTGAIMPEDQPSVGAQWES